MPVALQGLRADGRWLEAQFLADVLFDLGMDVGVGADRAGNFAVAHAFGRCVEALEVPHHFGVPQRHLQPERRRLCVDAVRTAHHHGILVLRSQGAECPAFVDVFAQDGNRLLNLRRQCGIDHIRGGQAVVHPLAFRTQRL